MGIAIITGASSGVGLEIAKQLDSAGHQVVLVARSKDALDRLASTLKNASVLPVDLASPDGPAQVKAAIPAADILVNNAGFGDSGPFAERDLATSLSMIQVNCTALTALTGLYLPGMLERRSGHILNVASTASFQAGPGMAVYYASKAYVLSFTEAIAEEVRQQGVKVTAFCPGAFASGFQKTANLESNRLVKGRKLPTSAAMATEALAAMNRGDVVYVPGVTNKVGAFGVRLMPRPLIRRVTHYLNSAE